jgi:5-methylcytosine-specific restriction protein A
MSGITETKIQQAYQKAKLVYNSKLTLKNAQDELANIGLNRNSASDLINNFKCMIDGQKYTRTNSAITTEYYLENILKDFGTLKLQNALDSLILHIEYYEKLQNTNMKKQREILNKYTKLVLQSDEIIYPDDIEDNNNLFEGSKKQITVNAYERSSKARKECIEKYGYICTICKFDFEKIYGKIGKDFIHVHHLKPLSEIDTEYKINPIQDLRPVCPNCHAMLHKKRPAYSIEEIKSFIDKSNL